MIKTKYTAIDMSATGKNIKELISKNGYNVRDIKDFLGLDSAQAVYKWIKGDSLPSLDNLYSLSVLLNIPMDEIIIGAQPNETPKTHC